MTRRVELHGFKKFLLPRTKRRPESIKERIRLLCGATDNVISLLMMKNGTPSTRCR